MTRAHNGFSCKDNSKKTTLKYHLDKAEMNHSVTTVDTIQTEQEPTGPPSNPRSSCLVPSERVRCYSSRSTSKTLNFVVCHVTKMLSDPAEAEMALVRYYNTTSGGKTGRKQVGPLWEALAMVRAGINIRTEPFLQVKYLYGCRHWVMTSRMRETQAPCQHVATCMYCHA